jgi:hypothetical protein
MGPRESANNVIIANLSMSVFKVENRNKQLRLNHVFKIVKSQCPSYMRENVFTCYGLSFLFNSSESVQY